MSERIAQIVEATFVLILVYLLVRNWFGFSSIIRSFSQAYIGSIVALQGR